MTVGANPIEKLALCAIVIVRSPSAAFSREAFPQAESKESKREHTARTRTVHFINTPIKSQANKLTFLQN